MESTEDRSRHDPRVPSGAMANGERPEIMIP